MTGRDGDSDSDRIGQAINQSAVNGWRFCFPRELPSQSLLPTSVCTKARNAVSYAGSDDGSNQWSRARCRGSVRDGE